ncbi:energy-coupled thiamine transporter ThiT [Candidatus Latescibacterota bacterium]
MRESTTRTRALAELAVAVALAAVLSLFRVKMPHLLYGGSVSLHSLPLLIVALLQGVRGGIPAGAAYGLVNFLITPYYVHPVQVLLDYPLAFGAIGLAGVASGTPSSRLGVIGGVVLGSLGRFIAHFLSGMVYFAHLAPEGTSIWKYSLAYNASYMVPETIVSLVAVALVFPRLARARAAAA